MINASASDVTADALSVMERTPDPRLREITTALVKHLHAFIRDARLTEAEFRDATAILNTMGQLTTDTHNEFVLMAGSLGVSSLVCLINNGADGATETSQNMLGPFWRMHSPATENGGSIVRSPTPGPPMEVALRIVDPQGAPVVGARVDIWHTSAEGLYENQDDTQADMNLRGAFTTDADGSIRFTSIKPIGYPLPTETMVGKLLAAQGRHPYRPAHVHALVFKEGFKTLISQIYADDDPRIHSDPQFGVTQALLGTFRRHDEPHPTLGALLGPWWSLDHRLVMEPGVAALPRPPIK
jgi:catechol 1,2-dioxygenase